MALFLFWMSRYTKLIGSYLFQCTGDQPTHTDQYIHFSSNHHVSAKISVVNTLLHRALTLCDEDKVYNELDHINKALHKNGYPTHYVHRAVKKQTHQITKKEASKEYNKGLTFMPYVKGVSKRTTRILNRAGVKTFYSGSQKLRDILSQPIGQTKRPLGVRVAEHKRATEQ
ncbi:hypothetical protein HOLleu_02234 [Holothuria leucospilota]|uniref:Helix-turn-helix domain-containing protein n=1 Tax=Holothuria leucospilota TaxID=206669 RepID=A0A9Q1CPC7_HOLLE|nr:hypothetical protein HOLleu_02234 [Holothuria leucospilota]